VTALFVSTGGDEGEQEKIRTRDPERQTREREREGENKASFHRIIEGISTGVEEEVGWRDRGGTGNPCDRRMTLVESLSTGAGVRLERDALSYDKETLLL
jgi:hypothetical protein